METQGEEEIHFLSLLKKQAWNSGSRSCSARVWDVQKNKRQCVIWAYPSCTPIFQMLRCELNSLHSAAKKGGVFSPRHSCLLLLQREKKWGANVAASEEQSRGWTGVTFWEKATTALCSTSTSALAPSLLPCTCLCHLGYCGAFLLVFCFVGCQRGQCWRAAPLLCRGCPGWLLPLARLQELPEGHRGLKNTAQKMRQQLCKSSLSTLTSKLIYSFHTCQNMSDILSVISWEHANSWLP